MLFEILNCVGCEFVDIMQGKISIEINKQHKNCLHIFGISFFPVRKTITIYEIKIGVRIFISLIFDFRFKFSNIYQKKQKKKKNQFWNYSENFITNLK